MNPANNLLLIREQINHHDIHALIIPTADPHQTEYLPDHWKHRQWLTGFTGSAGTALVTKDAACLWTDFRYWIQAEEQIRDTGFTLFPSGKPGVPSLEEWLCSNLEPGQRIAVDGQVFSMAGARKMKKTLSPRGLELVTGLDLLSPVWKNRPAMPDSSAYDFPVTFSGESRKDRLERIRQKLKDAYADWLLITALDDLAWAFCIRGNDIPSTPVNIAFSLMGPKETFLFINPEKIESDLAQTLEQDGIILKPYEEILSELKKIPPQDTICLDPAGTSIALFSAIPSDAVVVELPSIIQEMKCRKNRIEIAHSRETAVKDGTAVVNFMFWLAHETEPVTEVTASRKLYEFRQQQKDLVETSFASITAFGPHGAMCHYSPKPETDVPIKKDALFLFDSGGNYLTGTTDITRTVHLGTPAPEEIIDYTTVLKSHIAVATAIFPEGTRGYQIDTLARKAFWDKGQNFGHGTGHGVGFFLGVHEGPASISSHPIDVSLATGMILTNEPGLYREGRYGIRLENMILVQGSMETEFGKFLEFETLTLCPFETSLIDPAMLEEKERQWLNAYHERVYQALAPAVSFRVGEWLREKTRAV
ncbi:MAG: Xaa-Pro aminopeptidase [Bacteroidetes bacterium]|nr:MAG: Xaa-Pro aminopeptidase [Bacteroidota bacterium]